MSIIDKVLVAVDDKDISRDELEDIFASEMKSVIFSSLGRLSRNGFITIQSSGDNTKYLITEKGADALESKLKILSDFVKKKNFEWLVVSVSISDQYKSEREKLRNTITNLGFGLINRGVFLGKTNDTELIKNTIKQNVINATVNFLENPVVDNNIIKNYSKYWKIVQLKSLYSNWSAKTSKFIKTTPTNNEQRRILAKSQIIELAQIVVLDPKINQLYFNQKINHLYEKIRGLIN